MADPSTDHPLSPASPKKLQRVVDPVDRAILRVLAEDARTTNAALAQQVGIAASTCLLRVRALRESGVIRGFHADVDPAALGLDLQAMIAVKLAAHARGSMGPFVARMRRRPEVLDVYFVAGADDYLLHVAVESTAALRDFVAEHLSHDADVGLTETSLIFEHTRGVGRGQRPPPGTPAAASRTETVPRSGSPSS